MPNFNAANNLSEYMNELGRLARKSYSELRITDSSTKNYALKKMAEEIRKNEKQILVANELDISRAEDKSISGSLLDRLKLNRNRINDIANSLEKIALLPDPIGSVDESWTQPNGLIFSKVRVPIGVIGMIYESRPNVTSDAAALCLKSGNACILRGGSEGASSNKAIHKALTKGLEKSGLPKETIQLVNTTDRAAVGLLLSGLEKNIDLIIPRGGKNLIERVQNDARVPVLAHLEGLCHSYIHSQADLDKAEAIILNAKLRRTGICGATETMLVDKLIAHKALKQIGKQLINNNCKILGDKASQEILPNIILAKESDYITEHLAPVLNVKIVKNIDEAIRHINHYGSGHTDAIITENENCAAHFLKNVDSAICMHNTSTQFADGGEFGFGAEIGIATGRLHARGPVGAKHLTTYKYHVTGNGQIRN